MKIKTSELIGAQLDWAVAQVEGIPTLLEPSGFGYWKDIDVHPGAEFVRYSPSTDWSQGGPLIERFGVDLSAPPCIDKNREISWQSRPDDGETYWHSGETALIAAMRAIVAAKLGDEVDVPEGLV